MAKCPVCRQTLPRAVDPDELASRLQQVTALARTQEKKSLEEEFRRRLPRLLADERARAKHSAEREVKRDLWEARNRAAKAEAEIQRARREATKHAERTIQMAVKIASEQSQADIEKVEAARAKDHARFEADRARLQSQLDQLSRKLDKQTADQLGKEAEVDLLSELMKAFPGDAIEPVRRGKKGADIVHTIIVDAKRVGRIVYESKNVSNWQNNFITQAKKYQSQYDTPNVIVVSRSFPQRKKGLCIVKNIPVVDPRMAVCLASILRDGICELDHARATKVGRGDKAHQLHDYILSNKFVTRFREIAESIGALRDNQEKAKDWHQNAWDEEASLYDKIDFRRREVDSQIRTIIKGSAKPEVVRIAARG
jgi:hypothetical protein